VAGRIDIELALLARENALPRDEKAYNQSPTTLPNARHSLESGKRYSAYGSAMATRRLAESPLT
jgi:hypothetical protein